MTSPLAPAGQCMLCGDRKFSILCGECEHRLYRVGYSLVRGALAALRDRGATLGVDVSSTQKTSSKPPKAND